MYEAYWNLTEKPFRNTNNKKFFFYGESYEEAYLRLLYSISEAKGLMVLTGKGGCGKSFINKIFMKEMLEKGYQVAFITNPDLEPVELLQQILCEFGLEFQNKSKVELLKTLKEFVKENTQKDKLCIILIDEAHLIQSKKTLEEIRLLLNMESNDQSLISVVLSGRTELLDLIGKVPSLKERAGLQCNMPPLSCRETGQYIYHRMEKAGCGREIFSAEAIKEIYILTEGIPREINNICDLALLLGYGDNAIVIDQNIVRKAAQDLKGAMARS